MPAAAAASSTSTSPMPEPFHDSDRSLVRAIVVGRAAGIVSVAVPGAVVVTANAGTSPPAAEMVIDSPPDHSGDVPWNAGYPPPPDCGDSMTGIAPPETV